MRTRVLGLARQSNRDEDATTIPKQRAKIHKTCDGTEDFELVYLAEDGGVSGKYSLFDVTQRKDLAPWLTDPKLIAQWDALMYVDDDRLIRSVKYNEELHDWCDANGKKIMKTDGRVISMKTPTEWLSITVMAAVHEFYRRQIAYSRSETAGHLRREGKLTVVPGRSATASCAGRMGSLP